MRVSFTEGFALKEFKRHNRSQEQRSCVAAAEQAVVMRDVFLASWLCDGPPYNLLCVQTDEGSEFREEFKQTCEARKPRWSGCVETANGKTRYEFYPFYEGALTIEAVNRKLKTYQQYYNNYRPHDGI